MNYNRRMLRHWFLTAAMVLTFATLGAGAAAPATATSPAVHSFPTFGFDISPPPRWIRQFESDFSIVAPFTPPGGKPGGDALHVTMSPADRRTPRTEADADAARFDGTVEQSTLDGAAAAIVRFRKIPAISLYCERTGYMIAIRYI